MMKLLILDLLVEPRTFGFPGIIEFIRPFARIGPIECILITPQVQDIYPDISQPQLSQIEDYSQWSLDIEFFQKKEMLIANNRVAFSRQLMPNRKQMSAWLEGIEIDAFLCTGCPRNLSEPEDWMEETESLFKEVVNIEIPTLGICFGHQMLAHAHGGNIVRAKEPTFGVFPVFLTNEGESDLLFSDIDEPKGVFTHQDHVVSIPANFIILATASHNQFAAFRMQKDGRKIPIWSTQFHLEATDELFDRNVLLGWMDLKKRDLFVGGHSGAKMLANFANYVVNSK